MPDRPVLVFDLNGTLTDLAALDGIFRDELGSARLRGEWFEESLKMALAITASGGYEPFADIQKAALKVIEERYRRRLSWFARRRILAAMRETPPFADVEPGLRRLSGDGFWLAVLTNSGQSAATEVLKHGGLLDLFDVVLSADSAKRLKPASEPYRYAAKKLRVKPKQILMVAAHAWDLRGAHAAGLRTCFVGRPRQVLDELMVKPEMVVANVEELAVRLTGRKQRKAA